MTLALPWLDLALELRDDGGRARLPREATRRRPDASTLGEERSIIERVKRGDTEAFEVLVRRYSRRALAIAFRLMHQPEDAEDLVQDAFLRALERIRQFDTERPFGPWFFRVLINLGMNAQRSRALRATEPEMAEIPSPSDGPDVLLERCEVRDRFARALSALPPRQRLIVTLYEVDGMPSADIAELVGVTQETVRWHLHQARQRLREALRSLHG